MSSFSNNSRFASFLRQSILVAGLLASPAVAQDLDVDVVRNPDDTVTYDFRFQGPPMGHAYLGLGLELYGNPLHLPGMGDLYINPLEILGPIPLDLFGNASLQVTVPAASTNDISYFLQAGFMFPGANNLILAPSFVWLHQAAFVNLPDSFAVGWGQGYCGAEIWGTAGTEYDIVVRDENGNEVARKKVVIGANGSSGYCNFPLPGLKKGYTIEVWEKLDSNHTTQRWKKKIGG